MKIIPIAAAIITAIITIIFSSQITSVSIDHLGISWTLSYLMPRILILVLSIVLIAQIRRLLKGARSVLRIPVMVVIALLFPAIHFAVHPIYEGDFNKTGKKLLAGTYDGNSITEWINKSDSTFNGLVCFASPTCPHCVVAVSKLSRLIRREPDKKHIVFMFAKEQASIESFKEVTNASNIRFLLVPDRQGGLEICGGIFPTFLYFKDNQFFHKWTNDRFGFPAHDWVENDLE